MKREEIPMNIDEAYREDVVEEASKEVFGFWVYILSDCLLFASLFATFAVLHGNTFGGPSARDIFDLPYALAETLILLTSSFTSGVAMLMVHGKQKKHALVWFGITVLLGATFLGLEVHEFLGLIARGASLTRSGFLSAFFTLVGTHGIHVTIGLLWMIAVSVQLYQRGFDKRVVKKLLTMSIFWHFLDVIWIFIFTIVYLMGVIL